MERGKQSDQIGRTFTHLAVVYFEEFYMKIAKVAQILGLPTSSAV
jgi:hypothetical protein